MKAVIIGCGDVGLTVADMLVKEHHQVTLIDRSEDMAASIPDDLELVCMTDTKYNSMARPEITAFIMPSYDLGAVSMRLMTKMLNNDAVEEKEKCLGFLYQERQSTK